MIKAIIFDLDGVLIDGVEWHRVALERSLSLFGYSISKAEHDSIYNGLPTAMKLTLLSQRADFPRALHGFTNSMKQQYTRQILEADCRPDVKLAGLIRSLHTQNYVLAVASNSVRHTVECALRQMAIREYFGVVLSNEDVNKPKPDPEIYKKCLELLKVTPEECIIVEDSLPGIQAARQVTQQVAIVASPSELTQEFIHRNITYFDQRHDQGMQRLPKWRGESIEIVIPMAGLGQRFSAVGYSNPKPLIDVLGKPMIEWVVQNVNPKNMHAHFTFVCNRKHVDDYKLDQYLSKIAPGCSIISVPGVTEGAACTILLAKGYIDEDCPLLIANSDQWVDVDINDFLSAAKTGQHDGLIMTFTAHEEKWSYAQLDREGKVVRVAEKQSISDHATVGIYYFRQGKEFVTAAEGMIKKNIRTKGEFYLCPVYNELLLEGKVIRTYDIDRSRMHGLGTPEDLTAFLDWQKKAA